MGMWPGETRVRVGMKAGSSHFAGHQCMAAGHRLHGARQDSELCCTRCRPAPAFLKCCLSSLHAGYSHAVASGCFPPTPSTYSMTGQPKQAHKEPGAAPRGAVGAGMGHEATAVLQLPRSVSEFRDRPQIQPHTALVKGSCLQSITSPPGAWRGKQAWGHAVWVQGALSLLG